MKHTISFEEDRLVYVCGDVGKDGLTVCSYALQAAPRDVMKIAANTERETLLQYIKDFVQDNGLKGKKVSAVISGDAVTFRELTLPGVTKEQELKNMVVNEMMYYSEGSADYTVEYMVAEESTQDNQCRVLAFALPTHYIETYVQLLIDAGVRPNGIDISYNCLGKLIKLCYPDVPMSIALNVNQSTIDLRLIENGYCVLSRNIRINLAHFIETQTLDIVADEISDHINRILQFNRARHRQEAIDQLLLLCDFPQQDEFLTLLSQRVNLSGSLFTFGIKVRTADSQTILPSDYGSALGALIQRR